MLTYVPLWQLISWWWCSSLSPDCIQATHLHRVSEHLSGLPRPGFQRTLLKCSRAVSVPGTAPEGLPKGWLAQTRSSAMQMVSETGKIFDTFQLTKPVGWTNNVTNQTTFATNFQSTYVPSAAELYGYTGSTEAVAAILAVVAANPSNYTSLQVSCLI